jgi:limonene-1,2-epoxide hydrolase
MSVATREGAERFFQRWGVSFNEMADAFRDEFAENAEWYAGPAPIPVTHGAQEAVDLLGGFAQSHGLATVEVELLRFAHGDGELYSERIDHLRKEDGELIISLLVSGVMTLDANGRITYWRDYWDMQEFLALTPAAEVAAS